MPSSGNNGVLALSNEDVREVFDMDACVELLERGFRMLGEGDAVNSPRVDRSVRRDPDTTEPCALMPDGYLQHRRVGGASGVGTKYMVREDASVAGLFGSGWQAGTQILALCEVRDLDEITLFPERGLGAPFLATGPYIYEKAAEAGLGTELPAGSCTQELTP